MKRILLALRHPLLSLFCPGFLRDFPPDNTPGPWIACASLSYISPNNCREKVSEFVDGDLQEAYIRSRRLALLLDWRVDSCFGVNWAIRRPSEPERTCPSHAYDY